MHRRGCLCCGMAQKIDTGGESVFMEEKQINEVEIAGGEEQQLSEVDLVKEEEAIVETEPISAEAESGALEGERGTEEPVPIVEEDEAVAEEPEPIAQEGERDTEEAVAVDEAPEPGEDELAQEGMVEDAVEEHPMTALMEEEALAFERLRAGQIKQGEIVSVTPTEVLIDVGAKSEGLVPSKELERLGREGLENLQVGQKISVYVVRPEDRDGNLILSIRRAEEEDDWRWAKELHESGEHIETPVAGFNKGGLIVRLRKLRGFVPASQLMAQHRGSNAQQPEERWSHLVGTSIHVKIIEINRKRKRLILSERAALRLVRDAQKAELLRSLRPGEVRKGVVSSLTDFGAFVNLGGADGLVHLSELSWNRSAKPRELLKVGQEIEVYVLNVDQEKKRIALSLKRLEPEPWATAESRYYVGQLVEGTITRLANFGAFALVNDELEGLIHVSELSMGRVNHPQEVVQEGEKHVMRIIRIDAKRRRMGLSLKRVADPEYADLDWQAEFAEAEATYESEDTESDEALDDEVS